jgi:peptidoglycan-associated lipoprotein
MKRLGLLFVLGMLATALFLPSCHGPKPVPETPVTPPPAPKETTTVKPETPPPAPKPQLQESQLQTVYFDFDKYNLRDDAKAGLDANFKLLQEFPTAKIRIEGNCDERGTIEYNLALGEKRARAAMDYLVNLGITADRITIISYGKERPAVEGHNEAAWAKNRRDDFRVVSQ